MQHGFLNYKTRDYISNLKFYLSDDYRIYAIKIGSTWDETIAFEYKIKEQSVIKIADKQDVIPFYHEAENLPTYDGVKTVWKNISSEIALQFPIFKEKLLEMCDLLNKIK